MPNKEELIASTAGASLAAAIYLLAGGRKVLPGLGAAAGGGTAGYLMAREGKGDRLDPNVPITDILGDQDKSDGKVYNFLGSLNNVVKKYTGISPIEASTAGGLIGTGQYLRDPRIKSGRQFGKNALAGFLGYTGGKGITNWVLPDKADYVSDLKERLQN